MAPFYSFTCADKTIIFQNVSRQIFPFEQNFPYATFTFHWQNLKMLRESNEQDESFRFLMRLFWPDTIQFLLMEGLVCRQ
jgi:hypothetical protein